MLTLQKVDELANLRNASQPKITKESRATSNEKSKTL